MLDVREERGLCCAERARQLPLLQPEEQLFADDLRDPFRLRARVQVGEERRQLAVGGELAEEMGTQPSSCSRRSGAEP